MFDPCGRKVEEHVPRRIGEEFGIEEACARLALADDLPHQPRIGHRQPGLAHQPFRRTALFAVAVLRAFEAERPAVRRRTLRPQPFQPIGNLRHLFGQPQQRQTVIFRQFAQVQARLLRQHAAERDHPFPARRIDQDLRVGKLAHAEHGIERLHPGRHDQVRTRSRGAFVQPGKRGQHAPGRLRAIDQHHLSQRARCRIEQMVGAPNRAQGQARRLDIVRQLRTQVRTVCKDGHCQRQSRHFAGG